MNAILFYRHPQSDHALVEYNFYDNGFAPSNLVVRKVLMAMLAVLKEKLTQLEVEYNDHQLLDKWSGRAGAVLKLLGAKSANLQEVKSGDVVVSRSFRAELTPERFQFFYELKDLSLLSHYRLLAGEKEQIVYYFNQYLSIRLSPEAEKRFWHTLLELHVPYRIQ